MRHFDAFAVLFLSFGLFAINACSDDSFKSGNGEVRAGEAAFDYQCRAGQRITRGSETVSGVGGKKVVVKGQFCNADVTPKPVVKENQNIIFVVDFSGSMHEADPIRGVSCDRREIADNIIKRLTQPAASSSNQQLSNLQIALITFGSTAQARIGLRSAELFAPELTGISGKNNFCSDQLGSTNYEAAFTKTKEIAAALAKQNTTVILISDGMPSTYGTGFAPGMLPIYDQADVEIAKNKGKEAADSLRSIPNLSMKIFYRRNAEDVAKLGDPTPYLYQIVGGKAADVVVADTADSSFINRASQIDIPEVKPIEPNESGIAAVLSSAGQSPKNVELKPPQSNAGAVLNFETEAFELFGEPQKQTPNELKVTVTTASGENLESIFTLIYDRGSN